MAEVKKCSKCGIEKTLDCFYMRSDSGKLRNNCKSCEKENKKEYRKNNKEKITSKNKKYYKENKETLTKNNKKYQDNNKKEISENKKEYRKKNKGLISENQKEYRKENKEILAENRKEYEKERRKTDFAYKLRCNISNSIVSALKSNGSSKQGHSILEYLPYSFDELKTHIESIFESWMTWENQGTYKLSSWNDKDLATWVWNLDHIIPQSELPYTSMTDENFKTCWSLSNLRPISAKENILKGNKISEELYDLTISKIQKI